MTGSTRVFVAGHNGMVGSAIARIADRVPEIDLVTRSRNELDLLDGRAVQTFFDNTAIDHVYLAAAKVGGILGNFQRPAEFIYENMMIEANVIHAAHLSNVQKLLFLGSSCIYPKHANQPIDESELLKGPLEATNEPYAIAKICGIKLCESYNRQYGRDYRCVMPTNLYGPGDNFHPDFSHVVPGLMRRIHQAKTNREPIVEIWGSGTPKREFMAVDDAADACVHVMNLSVERYGEILGDEIAHINIGTGHECSIASLAGTLASIIGYKGAFEFDKSKPDGTPRKLLSNDRLKRSGWTASTDLRTGLELAYNWFIAHKA